jgi:RNA-directed DNA polymerase
MCTHLSYLSSLTRSSRRQTRPLGIPTVSDRIAQMVVQRYLEPIVEPLFHDGSYGYRPGRSAHQALSVARQRCWRYDWVLDLDIKSFLDTIDWDLLLRALRRHTDCKWVLLYIERWLKVPARGGNGVASLLLLFLPRRSALCQPTVSPEG